MIPARTHPRGTKRVDATQVVEQWEATAQLCKDLAGAAIDIKTVAMHLPGAADVTGDRLTQSRRRALEIVTAVERALHSPFDVLAEAELPTSLISWLRAAAPAGTVRESALRRLQIHLSQSATALEPEDIELLDVLTGVLDQQATALCASVGRAAGVVR